MLSFLKECPFCGWAMESSVFVNHGWSGCTRSTCEFHGQPRYQYVWRTDLSTGESIPESESFIVEEKYYVVINFIDKTTKISKLDIMILLDHIILPFIVQLDIRKYQEVLEKIKTIIVFS